MSLFVMVLLCLAPGDGVAPHVEAKKLMSGGNYDKAMVLLEEAVSQRNDWFYPLFLRGQCHLKMGKYSNAVSDFLEVSGMNVPDEYEAPLFYYTARAYYSNKDYGKALQTYEASLKLMPKSRQGQVLLAMGDCHVRLAEKVTGEARIKNLRQGMGRLNEVLDQKASLKTKERAAYQRGHVRMKLFKASGSAEELEAGINELDTWTETNVHDVKSQRLLLSMVTRRLELAEGDDKVSVYKRMADYTGRFLEQRSEDHGLLKKHAVALRGMGSLKEADAAWTRLMDTGDASGEAAFWRGEGRIKLKQYKNGFKDMEMALSRQQKERAEAWSLAAHALLSQKKDCYATDKGLYTKAESLLSEGLKHVAVAKQPQLESHLSQVTQTRKTLEENHGVDLSNHTNILKNVASLKEAIATNEAKLFKAKDQSLASKAIADSLKDSIEEFKRVIDEDKVALGEEMKRLKGYIREASVCGGEATYPNLKAMKALTK